MRTTRDCIIELIDWLDENEKYEWLDAIYVFCQAATKALGRKS